MANQVLDLEAIQLLMAETRTRGEYLPVIRNFFESGELAIDFSAKFPGKEASSLRNSVQQNCEKLRTELNGSMPGYKVIVVGNGDEKSVILVNMDTYHLQQQNDEQ